MTLLGREDGSVFRMTMTTTDAAFLRDSAVALMMAFNHKLQARQCRRALELLAAVDFCRTSETGDAVHPEGLFSLDR